MAPLSVVASTGLARTTALPLPQAAVILPAASAAEPPVAVPRLPDGVHAPASVTDEPTGSTSGLGVAVDARAVAVDAVPTRALTAYQRAEAVMIEADPSCHLTWQLVAAIGKVESNHGRFGGASMDDDGRVHPAILGPRLTGAPGTSRIPDTDAGLLDGDERVDRAVGPMQFIPSTWSVVGVDADGDDRRDPQDIDDASLATAVYLCSGSDDLATVAGQRSSVHRYNHSTVYVDLVLRIMAGYASANAGVIGTVAGLGYTQILLPPVDAGHGGGLGGGLGGGTDGTGGGQGEPVPHDPQPTFDVLPSDDPTVSPSPSASPSATPSVTSSPSATPSASATAQTSPTAVPTPTESSPTATPTTAVPTETPTETPTDAVTTATPSQTPPTATPTATPTEPPTDVPTDVPPELLAAWDACLAAGVDPGDVAALTACLVETTGLPADDPDLLALLANPPVTPPTGAQTRQPRSRRRA